MSIIISRNFRKLVAILSILLIISGFICLFNLTADLNINSIDRSDHSENHELNHDFELELSDSPSLSTYSGVGKAQNVTEYGEGYFLNNNINVSNNENATVIVPYEWEANEIAVNITNIYEYDKLWMNETFDGGYDNAYWFNSTTTENKSLVIFDWYNDTIGSNDSIYTKYLYNETNNWKNVNSYWNYTFNLDREKIPYRDWYFNFKYKLITNNTDWLTTAPGGTKFYCVIKVNDKTKQFNLPRLSSIGNDTWKTANIAPFTPEIYEFDPPGTFNISFGIQWGNADFNPDGYLSVYFDNITLELQTIPKPSQINLTLTDIEHGIIKQIDDISGYGLGNTILNDFWAGSVGGKEHRFSFASNSSGKVYINSDFFVKAYSSRFTTTEIGEKGSDFIVENDTLVEWTMFFPVSIPGTYSKDYYFNVSKPTNWNVTRLIDPYGSDKISQVLGTSGPGNSTLTIPNTIITEGVWEIVAESPNYVELANLFRKDGSMWSENDTFHVDDELKINATIKLIPNIDGTTGMLKIFSPNGSLWYQEGDVSVDINGNVEFSKITLGTNNASTGKYFAQIIWYDNNINISQVGFSLLQFNVIHKTNLTAIDSYFNQLSGDPLLLRVKFLDSDFNQSIPFATVTYSSTFGTYGSMIYQGSGIYFIDIDTSSLSSGDYYFSFNASKLFYENQSMLNLIHLNVIENVNLTTYVNYQEIHEDYLVELSYNQELQISCRALAEIEGVFLSGGSITFINGEYEAELFENTDYWFNRTIPISISSFSIGPNYAYLRFQQSNYTTTIFTFQVFVKQMEINVGTPDFEGLISGVPGETVLIKLNLTETGSTNYIENATVFYSWNFGAGYFNDIGSGIYELELLLPTGFVGSYDFELIISKEGILYKTKEFAFFIDINPVEGPNLFIWIIIFALIAISGIFGVLSLRSYVILPKRRRREAELISKIQVFKDVWNIRAVILINRESGLPIYSEEISINEKDQDGTLISGFVQAITLFSETFVGEELTASKRLATDYGYLKTIIDLDFRFFQLLVCNFETVRVLLILRDAASERLKQQLYLLTTVLHSKFSDDIKNFSGSLNRLSNEFQNFLNQFLFLHYNREFEITPNKNYYSSILESGELTNLERRLISVISSMIKINKMFTLKATIDLIEEKNEDLVLEALNSLILRKIIISPYFPKLQQKK